MNLTFLISSDVHYLGEGRGGGGGGRNGLLTYTFMTMFRSWKSWFLKLFALKFFLLFVVENQIISYFTNIWGVWGISATAFL